jgi:hypothetical protein
MKPILTLLLLTGILHGQTPDSAGLIRGLIDQLAAPKVRLRDEAQAALQRMPEAAAALREAAAGHASPEAQLRAARLLRSLKEGLWAMQLEIPLSKTEEDWIMRKVVVSPDGKWIAAAHRGGVEVWDASSSKHRTRVGSPNLNEDGMSGVFRSLAFSPDSRLIASTDHTGQIYIDEVDGKRIQVLPAATAEVTVRRMVSKLSGDPLAPAVNTIETSEVTRPQEPCGLAFLADGSGLVSFSGAGLTLHHFKGEEPGLMPINEIFPNNDRPIVPRAFSLSADGGTVALGLEVMGSKDRAALIAIPALTKTGEWFLPAIPTSIAVKRGGQELLVGVRDLGVLRCTPGVDEPVPLHRISNWVSGIAYAPDETSFFLSCSNNNHPMRQIALPAGTEIWAAPAAEAGFEDVAFPAADRIIATRHDNHLLLWTRQYAPDISTPAAR